MKIERPLKKSQEKPRINVDFFWEVLGVQK